MGTPIREPLTGGIVRVRSETLTTYFRLIKPGVLVMRQFGHDASTEMAELMMSELESIITRDGMLHVFTDLRGINRFDAGARTTWTDFLKKHRSSLRSGCALVNSKLVDMAVSLIGLVIGSQLARSTTSETVFIGLIKEIDPKFSARDFDQLSEISRASVG